jgi:hypothetical protein
MREIRWEEDCLSRLRNMKSDFLFKVGRLERLAMRLTRSEPKNMFELSEHARTPLSPPGVGCHLNYLMLPFRECVDGFPCQWGYSPMGMPCTERHPGKTMDSAIDFFSLNYDEFLHLFCPGGQRIKVYGGVQILPGSDPMDLSENIFKFVNALIQRN